MHKLSSLEIKKEWQHAPKPLKLYPPLELAHIQNVNDYDDVALLLSYFQQGHSFLLLISYNGKCSWSKLF
jgi:hypothetical protein